jgi:Na+/proline symporter
VLVIDMIQFFIKMTAVIAAAYFALKLPQVGGLHGLVEKLSAPTLAPDGKSMLHYLNILPDFTNNWDIALAVFILPIAVQWWAVWYPGAEPGGGSYIAQRMLSSKSEKDSLGAVLFFNVAHYVLRPWPWILVGLCSLVVYPKLSDIQTAFPKLDPSMVNHDIAYPAMLIFLPAGFAGLMIGGLIAANSSTILTHLNWGASYLVHDFYRRFVKKDGEEHHYVWAGRIATIGLFFASSGMVYVLVSAKDSFDLMLQVGAGTGMLYLLRWFWWRINAWCEVAAMISSFFVSALLFLINISILQAPVTSDVGRFIAGLLVSLENKWGISITAPISRFFGALLTDYGMSFSAASLIITIIVTTICWMLVAFFGPQTNRQVLIEFYKKVRPFGPGWYAIRREAGVTDEEARATHENIPLALLGWAAGCTMIWSSLFTVGNYLYGRMEYAAVLFVVFLVSTGVILAVINRLWSGKMISVEQEQAASQN